MTMDKGLLRRINPMASAVMLGDYSQTKAMDEALECEICDKDEAQFIETLALMFVKLEAREFALEQTIEDLQSRNAELLDAKKRNRFFSTIFVCLFLAISLYIFLVFLIRNFGWEFMDSARVVEAIFLVACLLIIQKSGFSLADLGITIKGTKESIRRMVPGTLTACAALIALKGLFIVAGVNGMNNEFFIMENFDWLFVIYLPVAALQEFLSRGVIQTAIESVIDERHATFWAILTASALFGLVHIQLSVGIAFASFICGLYWGYVYSKQKCLVGVSISHFLIGDLAYVLGFWDYLYII